jgi:hypothetical protein
MAKNREQKRARKLQQQTGWSYSECLRCTQVFTDTEVQQLVSARHTREVGIDEFLKEIEE